jgi:hypothetical protein
VAGHETAARREGGAGLEVWAHGGRDDAGADWIDDGGEARGVVKLNWADCRERCSKGDAAELESELGSANSSRETRRWSR